MYTQKAQQLISAFFLHALESIQKRVLNSKALSFAVFVRRISFATFITSASLAMLFSQGCIHIQPSQPQAGISIYQPERPAQQTSLSTEPQVIGQFVVNTDKNGAFLEGIQFKSLTQPGALEQVRVKMTGDDEWLKPAEINIYLYPQQEHLFEIAAIVSGTNVSSTNSGKLDDNAQSSSDTDINGINFALSNFRFLKSDATASINPSTLTYSVALAASNLPSPQRSRS